MRTEFEIRGADCPVCLNKTLAHLRAMPGVSSATASSAAGCLVVEHDKATPESLIDGMRRHLHGTSLASNEIVMDDIVPTITVRGCQH